MTPQERKEYDKQWKAANPEKMKEYRDRWKKKHPKKRKASRKRVIKSTLLSLPVRLITKTTDKDGQ